MTVEQMIVEAQRASAMAMVARLLMEQVRDTYEKMLADPALNDLARSKMVALEAQSRTLKVLALLTTPMKPAESAASN